MPDRIRSIFVRVSEDEKQKIKRSAQICGLSMSEYIRKASLGDVPRAVPPESFFEMNDTLLRIYGACSSGMSDETERDLIRVIKDLNRRFLLPEKRRDR